MKNPNSYKTPQEAGAALATGAQTKAGNYVKGVTNPNVDWAGAASSAPAQAAMAAGITKAIQEGRVKTGIERAGNTKWSNNAKVKGGATWSPQTAASGAPNGAFTQSMSAVIGDFSGAHAAYKAADAAGGRTGRMAGMNAWLTYMATQADARKASGGR